MSHTNKDATTPDEANKQQTSDLTDAQHSQKQQTEQQQQQSQSQASNEESIPNEDSEESEEEYNVERLVDRRRNPDTGTLEYEVKWLDYDSADNTWEPVENLKCPGLIAEFDQIYEAKQAKANKHKQSASKSSKKTKARASQSSKKKDTHLLTSNGRSSKRTKILLKEDAFSDSSDTLSDFDVINRNETNSNINGTSQQKTGFQKGLTLKQIVASCTNDDKPDKDLFFFVKWDGQDGIEMIEVEELEKHVPQMLCTWYRHRLYHDIELLDLDSEC